MQTGLFEKILVVIYETKGGVQRDLKRAGIISLEGLALRMTSPLTDVKRE